MNRYLPLAALLAAAVSAVAMAEGGGDVGRGRQAYFDYACYACHGYGGIGRRNIANRASGVLVNEEVFLLYLRARGDQNPSQSTQTMPHYPASSLPDETARDIYAYILTLEDDPPPVDEIPALREILEAAGAGQ